MNRRRCCVRLASYSREERGEAKRDAAFVSKGAVLNPKPVSHSLDGFYRLTHRPHSSSFLGFIFRILYMNPEKELVWGLWVV